MKETNAPLERLKHHVTGAIERGEKVAIVGVTAKEKFTAFHWPDHNIGKRESRRIREEHNALFNSHAELLGALEQAAKQFDFAVSALSQGHTVSVSSLQNCAAQARAILAKAKGGV